MAGRQKSKETSDSRNAMVVSLSPEANRAVAEWFEKTGMPKAVFVQRLMEWFFNAPEEVQAMLIGGVPTGQRKAFAEIMRASIEHWAQTGNWHRSERKPDRLAAISQLDHQAPAPRPAPHGK